MALTIIEVWQYLINSFGDYADLLDVTWCVLSARKLGVNFTVILSGRTR